MNKLVLLLVLALPRLAWPEPSTDGRNLDLDFVANQIPKLHPNFFFQLDPATYLQAVAALRMNSPAMTTAEFYVALASLVAMAGDAHTFISLVGATPSSQLGFGYWGATEQKTRLRI